MLNNAGQVWDVATGEALTPPLPTPGEISQADFSPDGRRVLATVIVKLDADRQFAEAWLWDVGQEIAMPAIRDRRAG